MSEITIYTKTGCPYCAAALKHYSDLGKDFTEVNISDQPAAKKTILDLTDGRAIVPVIVENGEVQTGFGGG